MLVLPTRLWIYFEFWVGAGGKCLANRDIKNGVAKDSPRHQPGLIPVIPFSMKTGPIGETMAEVKNVVATRINTEYYN